MPYKRCEPLLSNERIRYNFEKWWGVRQIDINLGTVGTMVSVIDLSMVDCGFFLYLPDNMFDWAIVTERFHNKIFKEKGYWLSIKYTFRQKVSCALALCG